MAQAWSVTYSMPLTTLIISNVETWPKLVLRGSIWGFLFTLLRKRMSAAGVKEEEIWDCSCWQPSCHHEDRASLRTEPVERSRARRWENEDQFWGHWLRHWSLSCLKPGNTPGLFSFVNRKKKKNPYLTQAGFSYFSVTHNQVTSGLFFR